MTPGALEHIENDGQRLELLAALIKEQNIPIPPPIYREEQLELQLRN